MSGEQSKENDQQSHSLRPTRDEILAAKRLLQSNSLREVAQELKSCIHLVENQSVYRYLAAKALVHHIEEDDALLYSCLRVMAVITETGSVFKQLNKKSNSVQKACMLSFAMEDLKAKTPEHGSEQDNAVILALRDRIINAGVSGKLVCTDAVTEKSPTVKTPPYQEFYQKLRGVVMGAQRLSAVADNMVQIGCIIFRQQMRSKEQKTYAFGFGMDVVDGFKLALEHLNSNGPKVVDLNAVFNEKCKRGVAIYGGYNGPQKASVLSEALVTEHLVERKKRKKPSRHQALSKAKGSNEVETAFISIAAISPAPKKHAPVAVPPPMRDVSSEDSSQDSEDSNEYCPNMDLLNTLNDADMDSVDRIINMVTTSSEAGAQPQDVSMPHISGAQSTSSAYFILPSHYSAAPPLSAIHTQQHSPLQSIGERSQALQPNVGSLPPITNFLTTKSTALNTSESMNNSTWSHNTAPHPNHRLIANTSHGMTTWTPETIQLLASDPKTFMQTEQQGRKPKKSKKKKMSK